MSIANTNALLSADEVSAYKRNGFVIPKFRFDRAATQQLYHLIYQVLDDNPEWAGKLIPNPHCHSSRRFGIEPQPGLMRFIADSNVLNIVEQIIGPDIIAWSATIFHKPAGNGKRTPWHIDADFYPIEPMETASIWIAATDSVPENGCLRVIPGSHLDRGGSVYKDAMDGMVLSRELDMSTVNDQDACDVVLEAGEFAVFDVRIVHGSKNNPIERPRTGFGVRYMPATSFYRHEAGQSYDPDVGMTREKDPIALDKKPLFLLRGVDRASNDFARNRYPEDVVPVI